MQSENDRSAQLAHDRRQVPHEFDRVARAYDLMTGLNPGYQRHLGLSARRLGCGPRARILDLCCGTGRSTEALVRAYPDAEVTGLDGSAGMLAQARRKPRLARVRWLVGDAMDPAAAGATGPYDAILMAYGIRNLPEPDRCLVRLLDLLAPGGRICFHEYSVADSRRGRLLWNLVAGGVIVPLGALAAGSTDLFRYLRRSVVEFDGVAAFEARLRGAGFTAVRTEPMDGWQRGIVHSFLAERPPAASR
jgi:ubiquinone/menaquinone biosynthesis C-methylase UbiE